jgi:hypothetical protein
MSSLAFGQCPKCQFLPKRHVLVNIRQFSIVLMSRSQTDNGGATHGQNEKILANQIDQKVTLLAFGNVPEEFWSRT